MRPGTRGYVGIGFLVLALIVGGGTSSATTELHSQSRSVDELKAPVPPQEPPPSEAGPPAQPAPTLAAISQPIDGIATRYGESYTGYTLGCGGRYSSEDPSIVAVGYRYDTAWPCGTVVQVCGPAGCLSGVRQDSCPGCGHGHVDLSEAGIAVACGNGADLCDVWVQAFQVVVIPAPPQAPDTGQQHAGPPEMHFQSVSLHTSVPLQPSEPPAVEGQPEAE